MAGQCYDAQCAPGDQSPCYTGTANTQGQGPCKGGIKTCQPDSTWGFCEGEVLPIAEVCSNGADDNCSGVVDEDTDADGDGFTVCGGDCCDTTECSAPALVNPGAFEAAGNLVDDDCDGMIDNTVAACDAGIASDTSDAMDYARAIDICQLATTTNNKWGLISATFTKVDGTGLPAAVQHSIRQTFGSNVLPQAGQSLALLSTGHAAGPSDSNPGYVVFDQSAQAGGESAFPADFLAANGGKLPNAPGCPGPAGTKANDAIMLTLTVRAPSNAKSFSLATNFFSSEYPDFVCSTFNDFFTVLLDSSFSGTPANPIDKNLAVYQDSAGLKYPVGVNLAHTADGQGTGLFNQCINGASGCSGGAGVPGQVNSCTGVDQLQGTGFDGARPGKCNDNSLIGGGTGWLLTTGNIVGGEVFKLRIAMWDTSDPLYDSLAVIDNFTWSVDVSQPGTVED
jgi:hypothetical protein